MSEPFEVIDNPAADRLEVNLDGQTAFAEYRLAAASIMFPHTVVPPAFEGRGVGSALVRYGMQMARDRQLRVIPTCSFFAGYIAKHPEYHDLVHPDHRQALGLG